MKTIMNDTQIRTLEQVRQFLEGTGVVDLTIDAKEDRYAWIQRTLIRFRYRRLGKTDKGLLLGFLQKVSGYSRIQIKRLVRQSMKTGTLKRRQRTVNEFTRIYTREDVQRLAHMDELHGTLSGPATKKLCERAYTVFGQAEYQRLAGISVGHLYNLRHGTPYRAVRRHFEKTRPTVSHIGERRKPRPEGRPGYLRVDTVHQGDLDGKKGVYHLNAVDEVTQFEIVCSVEKISERYLIPVLAALLEQFPFVVLGFHADNGSEYINQHVAKLLNRLLVELTKSRSRHSNGRVDDWRGNYRSRGVAVAGRSRCLSPLQVSRFQSPLVEPDVQISRIRLSRTSLRPSLSPRRPGCRGVYRGRASRRDTRTGIGDTPSCPASLAAGPSIAADGSPCISGSPGMRG
ncbi:MAG: hypothetical protein ACYDDA_11885 [Acidiferrobacteraceae bacterium]